MGPVGPRPVGGGGRDVGPVGPRPVGGGGAGCDPVLGETPHGGRQRERRLTAARARGHGSLRFPYCFPRSRTENTDIAPPTNEERPSRPGKGRSAKSRSLVVVGRVAAWRNPRRRRRVGSV